uniref:CS domain-containing protein n=1 Tax=Chrysotila carterae TaxID=13221 RepID=A0A7S4C070_CHRCT|eukprot:3372002-Pleurochrysis_carterae.AAC.1
MATSPQHSESGPLLILGLVTLLSAELVLLYLLFKKCRKQAPVVEVGWTQDLNCVEIDVPFPAGACSRDVDCKIKSGSIFLAIKGQAQPIFDNKVFFKAVQPEDSNWQLWPVAPKDPNEVRHIKISLVKKEEKIWKSPFGDKEL